MSFIRLSDDYNDHPKFDTLSDGAFRLWHQAIGFCRKYQTDGLVPMACLRKFKAYNPKRMRELLTPWKAGAKALWQDVPGFGINLHDYLEWNLSKEEEQGDRDSARDRMRRLRGRSDDVRPNSDPNIVRTNGEVLGAEVPGRRGSDRKALTERGSGGKPDGRSKRPIFSGQRFTVFEWQLEQLERLLGPHFEGFDVHAWFYELDARAGQSGQVVPQRDSGAWLLGQTEAEAKRRGLAMASGAGSKRLTESLDTQVEGVREILRKQGALGGT